MDLWFYGFMVLWIYGFMVISKGLVAQLDFLHDFFDGLWRFLRNHHKPPKKSRKKSLKYIYIYIYICAIFLVVCDGFGDTAKKIVQKILLGNQTFNRAKISTLLIFFCSLGAPVLF